MAVLSERVCGYRLKFAQLMPRFLAFGSECPPCLPARREHKVQGTHGDVPLRCPTAGDLATPLLLETI